MITFCAHFPAIVFIVILYAMNYKYSQKATYWQFFSYK